MTAGWIGAGARRCRGGRARRQATRPRLAYRPATWRSARAPRRRPGRVIRVRDFSRGCSGAPARRPPVARRLLGRADALALPYATASFARRPSPRHPQRRRPRPGPGQMAAWSARAAARDPRDHHAAPAADVDLLRGWVDRSSPLLGRVTGGRRPTPTCRARGGASRAARPRRRHGRAPGLATSAGILPAGRIVALRVGQSAEMASAGRVTAVVRAGVGSPACSPASSSALARGRRPARPRTSPSPPARRSRRGERLRQLLSCSPHAGRGGRRPRAAAAAVELVHRPRSSTTTSSTRPRCAAAGAVVAARPRAVTHGDLLFARRSPSWPPQARRRGQGALRGVVGARRGRACSAPTPGTRPSRWSATCAAASQDGAPVRGGMPARAPRGRRRARGARRLRAARRPGLPAPRRRARRRGPGGAHRQAARNRPARRHHDPLPFILGPERDAELAALDPRSIDSPAWPKEHLRSHRSNRALDEGPRPRAEESSRRAAEAAAAVGATGPRTRGFVAGGRRWRRATPGFRCGPGSTGGRAPGRRASAPAARSAWERHSARLRRTQAPRMARRGGSVPAVAASSSSSSGSDRCRLVRRRSG